MRGRQTKLSKVGATLTINPFTKSVAVIEGRQLYTQCRAPSRFSRDNSIFARAFGTGVGLE